MQQVFFSKKLYLLLGGAMALALLAWGCGNSDGSSEDKNAEITVETGSLTKAQFIKRAEAICEVRGKQIERELGEFIRGLDNSSAQADRSTQSAEIINTILFPIYEREIDQISSLGVPGGDEEEVTTILGSIQQSLEKAKEQPLSLVRGNPFSGAGKLAKAYGLFECGQVLD